MQISDPLAYSVRFSSKASTIADDKDDGYQNKICWNEILWLID